MKTIIVVSYKEDRHGEKVLARGKEMGVQTTLWDISQYPKNAEISFYPSQESRCPVITIGNLQIETLSGVYWRRSNGNHQNVRRRKIDEYMENEGRVVTQSLASYFPSINWISSPGAERLGGNKPIQLRKARQLGMNIPKTCITNSPRECRKFIDALKGRELTIKPVGTSFLNLDEKGDLASNQNKVVFTKIVNPTDILDNLDMVRNCPVIFQEAIRKEFDVRVTVVDQDVFSAKIILDGCNDPTNLDWRNYEGERIYSHHVLPTEIKSHCVSIVKSLGLRFGCVDLGFSCEGQYVFFEVNPQGQWLPSEHKLGYDISGSIVRGLTK